MTWFGPITSTHFATRNNINAFYTTTLPKHWNIVNHSGLKCDRQARCDVKKEIHHAIFGTSFLFSFVSLIFQISHFHPHLVQLMSFHLFSPFTSITPSLFHHSFTQKSKLTSLMNHFRLSLFLWVDWKCMKLQDKIVLYITLLWSVQLFVVVIFLDTNTIIHCL